MSDRPHLIADRFGEQHEFVFVQRARVAHRLDKQWMKDRHGHIPERDYRPRP